MELPAPDRELVRYKTLVGDSERWEGFELRNGDIIISTPPKCGTTWTQMICGLLVFQTPELPAPLDQLSPWLDMLTDSKEATFARLEAQTHRRFIKTHTPFDGLPYDPRATYLCVGRDPRDVVLSMLNHRANFDFLAMLTARDAAVGLGDIADVLAAGPPAVPPTQLEQFWEWVDTDVAEGEMTSGLGALVRHIDRFWAWRHLPNVYLLHYDDLKADLEGQMRALASFLQIEVPEAAWPGLVEAATFESMRANADRVAPDVSHNLWQSNADFFRNGTSGQWAALLDDAGQQRYLERAHSVMSPEIFTWLHRT